MSFFKFFLIPFEFLYFLVTSFRNFLYDKNFLKVKKFDDIKVISIGNISVGGSGKTPLTIFLAKNLIKNGKNVAVILRGYKSKVKNGVVEIKEGDNALVVGDEPLMIYNNLNTDTLSCKVIVSPVRSQGLQYIKDNYKNINTVILDDAMQHRSVYRDVNVLCIDVGTKKAREDFLKGALIPRGFLRESVKQGIKRTDVAILNYRCPYIEDKEIKDDIEKIKREFPKKIPICECFITDISITNYKNEIANINKDVIVFCAISKPANFFNTLSSFGYNITKKYVFLDHKAILDEKLEQIFYEAKRLSQSVICTEKDFVKLNAVWQKQCFFVKMSVGFVNNEILNNFV